MQTDGLICVLHEKKKKKKKKKKTEVQWRLAKLKKTCGVSAC